MQFNDFFDPCKPSFNSKSGSSTVKMSAQEMWRLAAPAGIHECLAYKPGDVVFSSRDIFEAIPEINQLYGTAKTLGDRLGQGVAGHGLGLHPAPAGGHLRCRENGTLFVLGACCEEFQNHRQRMAEGESPEEVLITAELEDEAVEELVEAAGFNNLESLSSAINELPPVSELGIEIFEA